MLKAIRGSNLALGVRVNQSTNYLNFSGKDDKHVRNSSPDPFGLDVLVVLWTREAGLEPFFDAVSVT